MTYLNIETSTSVYSVEFPTRFNSYCTSDLWYLIEELLPARLVDDLDSYRKTRTAKGTRLSVDFQPIINCIRQETIILKRPRKAGEYK